MSGYSSAVKLEIEKFDGRINFGLWQIQVKDVLIQSGLHKALKEKISGMKMMFSRRQEVSSWYYRTAMDKDELWQSGPQLHTGIGWR